MKCARRKCRSRAITLLEEIYDDDGLIDTKRCRCNECGHIWDDHASRNVRNYMRRQAAQKSPAYKKRIEKVYERHIERMQETDYAEAYHKRRNVYMRNYMSIVRKRKKEQVQ